MTLRKLSLAVAVAGLVLAPAAGFAASKHHGHARASAHASGHARTHVTRTHTNARVHTGARTTTRHVSTTRRVTTGSANRNAVVHRNVTVNRNVNVRVGHRYGGGVWYGPRRHYWNGRWYAYGVGSCWLATPIGFVWVCGV